MLSCLLSILLFTLAAVSLALISKKSFADLLAPVVFSVMLILYGFYICGSLFLGRNVILILFLLLFGYAALLVFRDKDRTEQLLTIVKSPSFVLYVAAVVVFLLFSINKYVNLWDCLRLWGAYPKALHTTGALQLGADALLYGSMSSYPPGMPLLCYFFTSFSSVFSESTLFFTYSYFGLALMLPFLRGTCWENKKTLLWAFLAVIFVPYFITGMNGDDGYYYSSLFIDMPLGICGGYFFSRAFHPRKEKTFDSLCAVLACGCLALLKDSGSFLAICGILGGVVCALLDKNRKGRSHWLWMLLEVAVLLFIYGSWKYLTGIYSAKNHVQMDFRIPSIITLARIFFHLIRTPVTSFFTVTGAIHLSLPAALLIIFSVKLLLAHGSREISMAAEIGDIVVQFLCCAIFFFGYCFSFIGQIENQVYPSYVRYFCTPLTAALFVMVWDCRFRYAELLRSLAEELSALTQRDGLLTRLLRPAAKLLRIGLVIGMVFSAVLILFDFPGKQEDFYVQAENIAGVLSDTLADEPSADVFLCIPGDTTLNERLHHRIYFSLLDEQIHIQNYFTETDITSSGSGYTCEGFMEHLISNGYEYVMLTSVDEALLQEFSQLFADAAMENRNLIYKVDAATRQLIRIA